MFASTNTTMTRNSGAIKTVVIALVLLGWLYTMYKYHETREKLENSRLVGERVRKEQEKLSNKLQDTLTEAEDHRQAYEREKREYASRLSSLQQQHKMLQAQHQDLEAEVSKIQREKDKEVEDHQSQDLQRTQEYERLKQEKDLEISNLKDEVANLKREKGNLDEQIKTLSAQLQSSQQQFQAQLQESQQRVMQLQQAVQQNQLANQQNLAIQGQGQQNLANQRLGQQVNLANQGFGAGNVPQNQNFINQFAQNPANNKNLPNNNQQGDDMLRFKPQNVLGQQQIGIQQQHGGNSITLNPKEKAELIEQNQQQHQVHPPNVDHDKPQHEKVDESPGSPINKTALEHRKDLEEHPNIQPPEILDAEEIKYGEHKKEEKPSNSANVKPKLGDPVLQVLPPNENLQKPEVQGFNIQPPGGADGKDNAESQKEQNLLPPRK
ncbi:Golgi integral membrane protein 4-like isoform X3 [Saccostrea echinata]|uniref:Golgi integral membrane protein 4-like isoform X3 n=1 Tax=Saccostrea echinata TaxID=191078 RepID=UPI002A7EE80B|nr:Golgi integral membrane protein 4-like isoform X3 [Saccostrea echinata]